MRTFEQICTEILARGGSFHYRDWRRVNGMWLDGRIEFWIDRALHTSDAMPYFVLETDWPVGADWRQGIPVPGAAIGLGVIKALDLTEPEAASYRCRPADCKAALDRYIADLRAIIDSPFLVDKGGRVLAESMG